MDKFTAELRKIAGKENCFDEKPDILASLPVGARAETLPICVARPVNLAQAADILALCSSEDIKALICGGNTAERRGELQGKYIILSTTGLSRILNLENRILQVQGGAPSAEIRTLINSNELFLPGLAPSSGVATVGGLVARNTFDSQSRKYSPIGAHVRRMEIITGAGERFVCAGQNGISGKLEAGFPLGQLYCGSFGCLGLIGALELGLFPKPRASRALAAKFNTAADAAQAASSVALAKIAPARILLTESFCSSLLPPAIHATMPQILVEYLGNAEETETGIQEASRIYKNFGLLELKALAELPDGLEYWLSTALARIEKKYYRENFSFPPESLPIFVERLAELTQAVDVEATFFGDPGIAQLTVALVGNGEMVHNILKELFILELMLNHRLESERDLELSRKNWQDEHGKVSEISDRIRKIFDPAGILTLNRLPDAVS